MKLCDYETILYRIENTLSVATERANNDYYEEGKDIELGYKVEILRNLKEPLTIFNIYIDTESKGISYTLKLVKNEMSYKDIEADYTITEKEAYNYEKIDSLIFSILERLEKEAE